LNPKKRVSGNQDFFGTPSSHGGKRKRGNPDNQIKRERGVKNHKEEKIYKYLAHLLPKFSPRLTPGFLEFFGPSKL
jgi:hypothetical protein